MSKFALLFRRKKQRIPKYFFLLFFSIAFVGFLDELIELIGITFENSIFDYVFDLMTLVLLTGPLIFYFLRKIQEQDDRISKQESILISMFENMEEVVFVCDCERNLIFINHGTGVDQQFRGDFPIPYHEWINFWEFHQHDEAVKMKPEQLPLIRALNGEHVKEQEIKLKSKGGEPLYFSVNGKQIFDNSGEVLGAMVVGHNITKRKEQEETIRFMAYHDGLTKLPNPTYFKEYLSMALSDAEANENQLAVMFLDLDGFKEINDTFGHDIGDLLLKEVAERLTLCAGAENFAARLGGDEFTLIFTTINDPYEAANIAETIISELKKPIIIQGVFCKKKVQGIAIFYTECCHQRFCFS